MRVLLMDILRGETPRKRFATQLLIHVTRIEEFDASLNRISEEDDND